jgi:UDP-glucuronate 4-epimerase
MTTRHYLITGTAGFVGFHLAHRLLKDGHRVTGIDGMTSYYDVELKRKRLALLSAFDGFRQIEAMLEAPESWQPQLEGTRFDTVIHLAAQAGVRYSIEAPATYVDSNLRGTFALLDFVRTAKPGHLLLASTSSVYGMSDNPSFGEGDETRRPVSFYAATKVAAEAMAHAYAHIHGLPTTAFRFFTVYGPWGRPDMALFKFTRAILAGEEIELYGEGKQERDFTYIDDLVDAILRLEPIVPKAGQILAAGDSISPVAPYRVVNIAGGRPIPLLDFVATLEDVIGLKARRKLVPMQQGDVWRTSASPKLLSDLTGYVPQTTLREGVKAFVAWYRRTYN